MAVVISAAASELWMPSKVADCFGARRPIQAFVPRDSEMRRRLQQPGMEDCAGAEHDLVAGAVSLESLREGQSKGTPVRSAAAREFSSDETQVQCSMEFMMRSTDSPRQRDRARARLIWTLASAGELR